MFIEYRGSFVRRSTQYCDEYAKSTTEDLWLIAKNKNLDNVEQLVRLYMTSKVYGCSFKNFENELQKLIVF